MKLKDFYCLELKFKDERISNETYHSHLYINDDSIILKIYHNSTDLDRKFSHYYNFENLNDFIELQISEKEDILISVKLIDAIGQTITSTEHENGYAFFSISLDKIIIEKKQENNNGEEFSNVYLNEDGFDLVKDMYSIFWKKNNEDAFDIKRMNHFQDYYSINNVKYRPEFKYNYHSNRNEKEFKIEKLPILKFYTFPDTKIEDLIRYSTICCNFYSFYLGNHIDFHRINYLKKQSIISYIKIIKTSSNLKVNSIQNILHESSDKLFKSNWEKMYILNEQKLNKAIKSHINSFYVDYESKFLLLFNILEILKSDISTENEITFSNNTQKKVILKDTLKTLKTIINKEFHEDFERKWNGLIINLHTKPLKTILIELLKTNEINDEIDIDRLFILRNNIIHGNTTNINLKEIEEINSTLYIITEKLILNILGLKQFWQNEN